MSIEYRKHQRYPVELAAEVDVRGELLMAATKNLSVGGVGIVCDRELPEGKAFTITLFLTQDGIEDADEEPFETKGMVQWCSEQDGGQWLSGVRFEALGDGEKAQLERFLSKLGS